MHKPAKDPNDLEKFFVERANAGDVDGLVALYEPNAIVAYGHGEVAIGLNEIREFFVRFLADRPHLDPSNQAPALCSGDLALTSSRLSNGDITAEVARRQPDGSWLWVMDHFALGNVGPHETRDRSPHSSSARRLRRWWFSRLSRSSGPR
jgi:ketosteroid isomerase-like protein